MGSGLSPARLFAVLLSLVILTGCNPERIDEEGQVAARLGEGVNEFAHSFIHSFTHSFLHSDEYLLNVYYVPAAFHALDNVASLE